MIPEVQAITVDISPRLGSPLSGFAGARDPARALDRPLEANALIWGGGDERHLLVSVDLLYAGDLEGELQRRLGLSSVTVLASHTHFAPGVDPDLDRLGQVDPRYAAHVVEEIAAAVLAAEEGTPTTVRLGTADAGDLFVNRRRPTLGRGINAPKFGRVVAAPNGRGPVDRTLRIHRLEGPYGLRAVIWNAGCHPVCFPHRDVAGPCFVGRVRERIRAEFGDIPVLFAQGFSGDVRPNAVTRRPPRRASALPLYVLGGFRRFVQPSLDDYETWTADLSRRVVRGLVEAESGDAERWVGSVTAADQARPPGWERTPRLRRVDLTPKVSIIAANAEMMSGRVGPLLAMFEGRSITPAGCAGEVIGYWPTDEMLRQGGYEGRESAAFFPDLDWAGVGGPDRLWCTLIQRLVDGPEASTAPTTMED